MSKKEKFALYLTPEKKALLERRFREEGSRSLTGFIERAIDFYLDSLSAGDAGLFLPASIKSCLDGRLDQLEDRLAQYQDESQRDVLLEPLREKPYLLYFEDVTEDPSHWRNRAAASFYGKDSVRLR